MADKFIRRFQQRGASEPTRGDLVDPGSYWRKPSDLVEIPERWIDPYPDERGMLTSDLIAFYAQHVKLISPFCLSRLRPASYELTLGPVYQVGQEICYLSEKAPPLVIEPNSIVFVSMREQLRLPHYIAARFNLTIDLIYKGLLLGTGPQVDPGFQGVLSCPLHNISNAPITINLGDPFVKIDFEKTTGFCRPLAKRLEHIKTETDLYDKDLRGRSDNSHLLFKEEKCWRRPILGYTGGIPISSSIRQLHQEFERLKRFSIAGLIGGVITFVALVFTILQITIGVGDLAQAATADYKGTQQDVFEQRRQIDALTDEVIRQRSVIVLLVCSSDTSTITEELRSQWCTDESANLPNSTTSAARGR